MITDRVGSGFRPITGVGRIDLAVHPSVTNTGKNGLRFFLVRGIKC